MLPPITADHVEIVKAIYSSPRRWAKGNFYSEGRVCISRAFAMSMSPFSPPASIKHRPSLEPLVPFLPEDCYKVHEESVMGFNDAKETTFKDIQAFLDRAEEGLRRQG